MYESSVFDEAFLIVQDNVYSNDLESIELFGNSNWYLILEWREAVVLPSNTEFFSVIGKCIIQIPLK